MKGNSLKILHLNSYYSSRTFYKNLYDRQIKKGIGVCVYVFVPYNSDVNEELFGEYTILKRNHFSVDRVIFHIKQAKIYKDLIDTYSLGEFSLIHAHSLFTNGYLALQAKREYGLPYIVAVRNTDVNVFFKKMRHLRKIGLRVLLEAEKVIFLSESYKEQVVDQYIPNRYRDSIEKKSVVIPNGVDDFWINKITQPKCFVNERKLSLLQVSKIDKNKNVVATIDLAKELSRRGYHTQLSFVGEISDEKIYRKVLKADNARYLGVKNNADLIDIYRENDIFVMPSINESFGLVYAEAMSQGLPILYTRGQGFDNQFNDGEVGYSVNCYDVLEMADKVEEIIANYNTISSNCLEKVKKFEWDIITDLYIDIYRKIVR